MTKAVIALASAVLCFGAVPVATASTTNAPAATDAKRWTAEAHSPLSARTNPVAVWSGTELLVVGGDGPGGQLLRDGAAFTPRTGKWRALPTAPEPVDGSDGAVWTGSRLVVAGASVISLARMWTTLPASPITGVTDASLVEDGAGNVVEVGGQLTPRPKSPNGGFYLGDTASRAVASYSFATGAWTSLPDIPTIAGHPIYAARATNIGGQLLLQDAWELITPTKDGFGLTGGGDDFSLDDHGDYRRVRSSDYASVAAVGKKRVLANGITCLPLESCPPRFTTPFSVIDARGRPEKGISSPPIPQTFGVSTGTAYVVVTDIGISGGPDASAPGDAAVLDVQTKKWSMLPSAKKLIRDPESLVWTGQSLLLYGEGRLARLG